MSAEDEASTSGNPFQSGDEDCKEDLSLKDVQIEEPSEDLSLKDVPISSEEPYTSFSPERATMVTEVPEVIETPVEEALVEVVDPPSEVHVDLDWKKSWSHAANQIFLASSNINSLAVSSPEVVASMMSKYIVYNVKTEPLGYTVRRRYNDFDWLREVLTAKYLGLFIPSSPPSSSSLTGTTTDPNGTFVRNRMVQLQLFVDALIQIPFIRTDPSFISFISMQDEKEFKALTEQKKDVVSSPGENSGIDLWFQTIDNHTVETETDRPITDFKRQLELLRSELHRIDKLCRNAGKKAMAYSLALIELNEGINKWALLERDIVDPTRNEYINGYAEPLMKSLSGLVGGVNFWSSSSCLLPKVIAGILMSSVQFQRAQIEAFIKHLSVREELVANLFKAEKERLKLLDEKQRTVAAGASAKKSWTSFNTSEDVLEDALKKKTDHVSKLQTQLSKVTKGLIYCEMDRFNLERCESISKLLTVLAAMNIKMSQSSTEKWSQVVSEQELNGVDSEALLHLYSTVEEEEFN